MIVWPEDLCAALADRGFQVARFDNRDSGLSTHLTGTPTPGWLKTMLRPSAAPYRLDDMAEDALAVMDALGGRAPGGRLHGRDDRSGTRHPVPVPGADAHLDHVHAVISHRDDAHDRGDPRPRARRRNPGHRCGTGSTGSGRTEAGDRISGIPAHEPAVRDIGRRSFERDRGAEEDAARQRAAVIASGDRRRALAGLRMPVLIIHGEQDPIIRPKGGRTTAQAIPGARLVTYPAWATTCPERYGQPSWRRFPLWRLKPSKRRPGRPVTPPGRR